MTDTQTQSSSKMSVAQKLDKALEYKDIGNSFYKEGNFKNAAKNYHKAILYLKVRYLLSWKHQREYIFICWNLKLRNTNESISILSSRG